jgi:hypothetical protein
MRTYLGVIELRFDPGPQRNLEPCTQRCLETWRDAPAEFYPVAIGLPQAILAFNAVIKEDEVIPMVRNPFFPRNL